jgi:flagellar motor switch protein FliG
MASTAVGPTERGGENPLLLAAESGFVPADIPGLRKAAILMVAVGDELAKTLFLGLGEEDVRRVTDEITKLGPVPPELLTQVLTEFYGLLETQQYMVRGGPEYAVKLLTEAFGSGKAATLLAQVRGLQERSAGDLGMLQKMDPQQLSKFLENEHPQTVALVLAHLDAKRGAILLMHLEESLRVQAVQRLAEMRQFSPEMAQKVAIILHRRLKALGSNGRRGYAGFKAVAELLNRLDQVASKGILEEIEQQEPKLAIGIRTLMFTFEDLLTVPASSIRELVGAADKKVLAIALKGAKDNIKAHLFQGMSSRAIEMLKEDMEVMGPVRGKDVAEAQQELLNLARRLEAEGKMTLKVDADDDLAI